MPTLNVEGSTLTDGTEQVLATITANKYLQFSINLTPMDTGDTLKVFVYKKVKAAGTLARFHVETYSGPQITDPLSPVRDSGPFWTPNQFRVSIQRTAGTDRTYDWEILEA